jgi:DNA invertase Pin-like site-specific DNA recombinase
MIWFEPSGGMKSRVRKLNEEQVRLIRKMYQAGKRGKQYGKKFGISESQFNKVGRKEHWKTTE